MITNEDRELIETKLMMIDNKLESYSQAQTMLLNQILEQTKRTNGRVDRLESWKEQHEKLNAEVIAEYNLVKKNAKAIVVIIAVLAALMVLQFV